MAGNNKAKLIQLIHVAKNKLHLTDENYRAILEGATNGKTSCKSMSEKELRLSLNALKKCGFTVKSMPVKDADRGQASEKQLEYIKGLWELCARVKTESALQSFVKRITRVSHVRFLNRRSAQDVILALRDMAVKAGYDPDGIPGAGVWHE